MLSSCEPFLLVLHFYCLSVVKLYRCFSVSLSSVVVLLKSTVLLSCLGGWCHLAVFRICHRSVLNHQKFVLTFTRAFRILEYIWLIWYLKEIKLNRKHLLECFLGSVESYTLGLCEFLEVTVPQLRWNTHAVSMPKQLQCELQHFCLCVRVG